VREQEEVLRGKHRGLSVCGTWPDVDLDDEQIDDTSCTGVECEPATASERFKRLRILLSLLLCGKRGEVGS